MDGDSHCMAGTHLSQMSTEMITKFTHADLHHNPLCGFIV